MNFVANSSSSKFCSLSRVSRTVCVLSPVSRTVCAPSPVFRTVCLSSRGWLSVSHTYFGVSSRTIHCWLRVCQRALLRSHALHFVRSCHSFCDYISCLVAYTATHIHTHTHSARPLSSFLLTRSCSVAHGSIRSLLRARALQVKDISWIVCDVKWRNPRTPQLIQVDLEIW